MKNTLLILLSLLCYTQAEERAPLPSVQIVDDKARSYWAYTPPVKEALPEGTTNAVDAFINRDLQAEGISPNGIAEPAALLRRITYDLTGLPPTEKEYEDFLAQEFTPELWAQTVDRLLTSPEYGRKLASLWLDLVRYAETNAFERDSVKPEIWRYRDYVIDAFNNDMPYDQFLTEQLAGDEIENPTFGSNIATGFLCLMQRDDEPADHPQAHADMVSDMIDVTGEAFLGTTMGCAKCHDHKGDPIRQKDYYSMRAYFEAMATNNLKTAQSFWKDPQVVTQQKAVVAQKEKEREELIATINLAPIVPDMARVAQPKPALIPLSENGKREVWHHFWGMPSNTSWNLPSWDQQGLHGMALPVHGGARPSPYSEMQLSGWREGHEIYAFRKDFSMTTIPENLLVYTKGNMEEITIFFNGVEVYMGAPIQVGEHQIYALSPENKVALTTGKNTLGVIVKCTETSMQHFNIGLYQGLIKPIPHPTFASLFPHYLIPHQGAEKVNRLKTLNEEIKLARLQIKRGGVRFMKQHENMHVLPSYIHLRGSVHGKGDGVEPAVPAVMVPTDEAALIPITSNYERTETHGRRLALAQWIANRDNPLTARVFVNRLWQQCFGIGIVASANDFGVLGEDPTNQALLDWLAVEFMDQGWKIKPMMKLLLTSETYLRSTFPNREAAMKDPLNIKHWKHNPRRLTAEEIRDTFLTLSQELRLEKPGAVFVRPRMPDAVLKTSSTPETVWPMTEGPEANSRSIYVHVKRSIQLPLMSAFDAPQRDSTCPSRFATTVPTQALTMLNSAFINDRAAIFGQKLQEEFPGDYQAQIKEGFSLATGRAPLEDEITELDALYQDLIAQHHSDAKKALTSVCLLLLNLNETIYLD